MRRGVFSLSLVLAILSCALAAQVPKVCPRCALLPDAVPDPMGGGQAEYSAERGNAFSRLAIGVTVSSLGIGVDAGTNLGTRLDVRLFGNYTNITHNFRESGFEVSLNVGLANSGAMVDFYPLHRFPLRFSPGYLYFNQNRVAASVHAQQNATFTINNVDYASDNANPVYGTGRLLLGGGGFMATAGLGHIVSHTHKAFSFPFEAGVALINTPIAQFSLFGNVCAVGGPRFCEPAAQFPAFAANLAAQVATWNRRAAPFHIYPILEGGAAYSFTFRRRSVE